MQGVTRALRKLTSKEFMKTWTAKNRMNVFLYGALFVFILFVYHLLSDGDFSFLLTLGGIVCCFGFMVLTFKVATQRSCTGVSLKTLQCYAIVFAARLVSILLYDGYLPYDKSGDWLYQAIEIFSLVAVCVNIYLVLRVYPSTYKASQDTFGVTKQLPHHAGIVWLVAPALLLAMLLHPSLNNVWVCDVAWALAMYLEGVAVLPQLFHFQRLGGEVESFTSHFVFSLGASRFLNFLFWVSSYHELNDRFDASLGGRYVGYIVLASQLVQLLLMADYFYYYIKSIRSGGPMLLPSSVV